MNLIKKMTLAFVASILIFPAVVSAQTPLEGKALKSAVTNITAGYTPWKSAGWSGKLQGEMLPVSVTMKTYMRRDSLTLISLRAPLIGEVARIEIDNKNLLIVNKYKKRYSKIDLTAYGDIPSKVHSSIQDILIGRVAVIGNGVLSDSNSKDVDIIRMPGEGYVISCTPKEVQISYGYGVDESARIVSLMAVRGKPYSSQKTDNMQSESSNIALQILAEISYAGDKPTAALTGIFKNRQYDFTLKNIDLEFNTSGFSRLDNLNSYTQSDLKETLSF